MRKCNGLKAEFACHVENCTFRTNRIEVAYAHSWRSHGGKRCYLFQTVKVQTISTYRI